MYVGWITWSMNKTKTPPKWQTCSTQRATPGSVLSVPIGKYTLWNEKLPDWGNSDFSDLQGKVTYRDSKIPLPPLWWKIKQRERENKQSVDLLILWSITQNRPKLHCVPFYLDPAKRNVAQTLSRKVGECRAPRQRIVIIIWQYRQFTTQKRISLFTTSLHTKTNNYLHACSFRI